MPAPSEPPGYHGRPALKAPVWSWEIPLYFFVGGVTGSCGVLALFARLSGAPAALATAALATALAGAVVSAVLLVLDLGRPLRFLYMLRVFKWRSPMSVGVWVLTAYGGGVVTALLLDLLGGRDGDGLVATLETIALVPTALFGALVCTYTGVLVAVTAVPVWHRHRRLLPVHFGAAALGSGAAVLQLYGFHRPSLRAIGVAAAAAEIVVALALETATGPRSRAAHAGRAALLLRGAAVLSGPAALLAWLVEWPVVASVLFLAGALASRFGWMEAGKASAADPEAALAPEPTAATRAVVPQPERVG